MTAKPKRHTININMKKNMSFLAEERISVKAESLKLKLKNYRIRQNIIILLIDE